MSARMGLYPSKAKILLGQVIGTKMKKTAKVRVERLVLDEYVMQYYPRRTTVFAHDAQEEAKVGDIVLVKALPLQRSKHVKYGLDRIIYSLGNVTDPITGRKCDGFSYWNDSGSDALPQSGAEDGNEAHGEGGADRLLTNEEQNIGEKLDLESQLEGTPV